MGLTLEQSDAVTTGASPLCVIAGAGSGKTRVLTRRIAWQADQGRADPRRMLAVTFTRRAARELRARLRRLGLNDAVRAGTFHAIAMAQLRLHAADTSRQPPRLLGSPRELIAELRPEADRSRIADIISEIGLGPGQARDSRPLRRCGQCSQSAQPPGRGRSLRPTLRRLRGQEGEATGAGFRRRAGRRHGSDDERPQARRGETLDAPAPARRRVPGHKPTAVRAAAVLVGARVDAARGGRPRPGDLWLERGGSRVDQQRRPILPRVRGPAFAHQLPLHAGGPRGRGRGAGQAAAARSPTIGPRTPHHRMRRRGGGGPARAGGASPAPSRRAMGSPGGARPHQRPTRAAPSRIGAPQNPGGRQERGQPPRQALDR